MVRCSRVVAVLVLPVVLAGVACVPKSPSPPPQPPGGGGGSGGGSSPSPGLGGCPLFPPDSYWHRDVSGLPTHPSSAAWIATSGAGKKFHADFGSGLWDGGPIGIPYTTVAAGQPLVPITFDYDDESDPGPYPLPPDAPIEGGANSDGDRHVLVVDTSSCHLYEVYAAHPGATWHAGSGAAWDLRSNARRPDGWTSADAAGLPILPGLVRYDEVAAGRIDHAIRVTVPVTQRSYVWPASHQAGSTNSASAPPMGAWFRLKASVDVNRFTGAARVIAIAMQRYGMIVADNGSAWYFSGAPDPRWDNDNLHQLDVLTGADLEAVVVTP